MTLDRDRIQRFLAALRGNLEKLRVLAQQDLPAFKDDFRSHHAAMRLLQISIEDMRSRAAACSREARSGLRSGHTLPRT